MDDDIQHYIDDLNRPDYDGELYSGHFTCMYHGPTLAEIIILAEAAKIPYDQVYLTGYEEGVLQVYRRVDHG